MFIIRNFYEGNQVNSFWSFLRKRCFKEMREEHEILFKENQRLSLIFKCVHLGYTSKLHSKTIQNMFDTGSKHFLLTLYFLGLKI